MQSVLPNQYVLSQPATYSSFEADDQYRRAHEEPIGPNNLAPLAVRSNVESHPSGSTVIQTETPTKHHGGFMGKMENLKLRVGEHMGIGTDTATRWSLYQFNEPLFGEFRANIVNGTNGFSKGFLFISQHHLCFSSFTDAMNRAIKVSIPLKNIVKIGLAQRLRNTPGTGVVLTPLSSLSMKANSLQVFTKDGVLHQFFGFRKKTEQMFNCLNHVWQSSGVVMTESLSDPSTSAYQQALLSSGFNRNLAQTSSYSNSGVLPNQFVGGQALPAGGQHAYPVTTTYVSTPANFVTNPASTSASSYLASQPATMEVRHVNHGYSSASAFVNDRNMNGIPDNLERNRLGGSLNDRNMNGIPDSLERNQYGGSSSLNNDRNMNGIPDSLERNQYGGSTLSNDRNMNGIPDSLERNQYGTSSSLNNDRNMNGIPDSLERNQYGGSTLSNDRNMNGIPDNMERRNPLDRNGDGRVDLKDLTGQPSSSYSQAPVQGYTGQQQGLGYKTANPLDRNNDGKVDLKDLAGQPSYSQAPLRTL